MGKRLPTAAVDTAKVAGRRTLRFESMDEVVAELDRLENAQVVLLGNWSLGQIYWHLARGFDGAVDGVSRELIPWYLRLFGPLAKQRILKGRMGAGFNIPKAARSALIAEPEVAVETALAELRAAIARFMRDRQPSRHPIFGNLTVDEWTMLMLRHCELHLSFVLPLDSGHNN